MPYQLRPDQPLGEIIEHIAAAAAAVAGVPPASALAVTDLIVRARVVQSVSCGLTDDCHEIVGGPWGAGEAPMDGPVRPVRFEEEDLEALPRMFAAAVADLAQREPAARGPLEERLAETFRAALAPYLYETRKCGHGVGCTSPATDPFRRTE
jgi:hypothetical protein